MADFFIHYYRVILLYILLHVVMFFVEWYRHNHCNMKWCYFLQYHITPLSQFLIVIDFLIAAGFIVNWAFEPACK